MNWHELRYGLLQPFWDGVEAFFEVLAIVGLVAFLAAYCWYTAVVSGAS